MVAADWIYQTLAADETLTALLASAPSGGPGIYDTDAEEGAPYPYVVFNLHDPNSVKGMGARRVWLDGLWIVRGVDECESFEELEAIADRIDALLHLQSGTVEAGRAEAFQEDPFELAYAGGGRKFRELGGAYRVYAQEG